MAAIKILFVYPDLGVRGGAQSYQIGIGMLSAVLRQHGHETRLHTFFGRYDIAALKAEINSYCPQIIAFSAVSPQFKFVRRILEDLQPLSAFTILGGPHATLMPECLEAIPGLDAVCIGEGEYPLLELASALEKSGELPAIPNLWIKNEQGKITRHAPRPFIEDLNKLPFPDRELLDYQAVINSDFHTALFMFSRGCPYKCTFCSNHALSLKQAGRYVRFRSVDNCLAEIKSVTSRYHARMLYFNDDCFTAQRRFVEEFCSRYQREFTIPFAINARPETLNDEICAMLKAAGCVRVSIGIESGSEKFRREVLGRSQSNARIIAAFAACRRAGLKTKSFNIVGFPHETPVDFQETIALNAVIQPDSVIIGVYEPYPGTRLAEDCRQKGWLPEGSPDDHFLGRMDTVLTMPKFPRHLILRSFRNFGFNVYKRKAPVKALFYKIYYSRLGENILKIIAPIKPFLRRMVMGV